MHRPLAQSDLLPDGPLARLGRSVLLLADVDSTNALLLSNAARLPDGTVASAEHQSAGRGRFGRTWEAPRGASVLLSVLMHEPPDSALRTRGAMLGCVAAAEAIERATDCRPSIAWPNDLLIGGRKLAGVLAETTPLLIDDESPLRSSIAIVIGVGINCLQQPGHFRSDATRQATSLEIESKQPIDRPAVARALLERLDHWLTHIPGRPHGLGDLHAAWLGRCGDVEHRVTLSESGRQFDGLIEAIDQQGDLHVRLTSGERKRFAAATTTRIA